MPNDRACKDCGDKVYDFQTGDRCNKCQASHQLKVTAKNDLDTAEMKMKIAQLQPKIFEARKKKWFKTVALIWLALWVTMGAGYALYQRSSGSTGCVYRSIASIANPGFVLGCELFRERWEIGK